MAAVADTQPTELLSDGSFPISIVFSVAVIAGFIFVIFNCAKKQEKTWTDDSIYGHGVKRVDYRRPNDGLKTSNQENNKPVTENSIYGEGVTILNEKERNGDGRAKDKDSEDAIYGEGVAFQDNKNRDNGRVEAKGETITTEDSIYGQGVSFKNEDQRKSSESSEKSQDSTQNNESNYTELERTQIGSALYARIVKPPDALISVAQQQPRSEDTTSNGEDIDSSQETESPYSFVIEDDTKIPVHRVPPSRPPPVLKKASADNDASAVNNKVSYSHNKDAGRTGAKCVYEVVETPNTDNADDSKNYYLSILPNNAPKGERNLYPKIDKRSRSKSEDYATITLTDASDRKFSSPFPDVSEEDYGSLSTVPVALASPDGIYDKLKYPVFSQNS